MSYLALYREFRPSDFDSMVGQEHVVQTLVNQIKTGRVGHAYLFCGARGTGKTTAAKVFAKAINCLSPKNGSPCGECEVCKRLAEPTNLDIIEMDAASNNKVENVRDLRDKIQYPPVAGKYKVYIVDEVHMLTPEAFNALLKTLEEPPEHAVFILATTEVQKLPSTILSRCLRFDFKLISTQKIADYICKIYDKVGKKYQKEAVDLIARAGEGSMRDALSVADVCVSYSEGELTYDDVLEVLGASDRTEIEKTVASVLAGNPGDVLSRTEALCVRGKSVGVLNADVCAALRDLLVIKTCAEAQKLLSLPADKFEELKKIAGNSDEHAILRAIEIFSSAEADLKYSTHPKIVFETAALKAAMPESDYNIDALLSRVNKLEKKIEELSSGKFVLNADNSNSNSAADTESTATKTIEKVDVLSARKKAEEPKKRKAPESSLSKELQNYGYAEEDVPEPPSDYIPEPPPEEDYVINSQKSAYKSVNDAFADKKTADLTSASQNDAVSSAECADPRKAWGMVLRNLRADKEIMLWVACQDVDIRAANGLLYIIAGGTNEYNLLVKPSNLQKLADYVMAACGLQTRIIKTKEELDALLEFAKTPLPPSDNGFGLEDGDNAGIEKQRDEKAVKEFFGDENVEILD